MTYLVLGEPGGNEYQLFAHLDTRYVIGGSFVANQANSTYTIYNLDASGQIIYQKVITIGTTPGALEFLCEHTPVQKAQTIKLVFSGGSVTELYYVETEDPGGSDAVNVFIESGPMPEVYDLIGRRLAILKDAYDVQIDYELDTWPTLNFSLPKDSPHWSYISNEFRVLYEDGLYVIKQTGAKRESNNAIMQTVTCPSIGSDLNYKYNQVLGTYLEKELIPVVADAQTMMDTILTGSGWTRGSVTVDQGKQRAMQAEWNSVASNLQELKTKFGGFLVFRPQVKQVDLLLEPGEDNGVVIEYAKNLTEIEKNSDSTDFVTRMYAYGSEEDGIQLTFNTVNTRNPNQSYIENFSYFLARGYTQQQITNDVAANGEASVFIKLGKFEDGDYVDPEALYTDTIDKLDNELCLPKVTYKISLVDLAKISGFEQEAFGLGDWVTVRDSELGIDVKVRIVKLSYYPGFPEKTTVELANAKDTLSNVLVNTVTFAGQAQRNTNLRNLMKNAIDTYATAINGAHGKLKWSEDVIEAIEINQAGAETGKRTRMTPGGFGVSSDGGQTYRSAMTGDGILAEEIICNNLHILDVGAGGITITGGLPDGQIASGTKWNNSVFLDNLYNGIKINTSSGFLATRSDNKVRSMLNATYGIAIQKGDGTGGNWIDQFYVDASGILHAEGMETKKLIVRDSNGTALIDALNSIIDLSTFATVRVGGKITYADVGALSSGTFIPDSSYITTITQNTVTTSYVNALSVTSRRLTAINAYGVTLLDGYGDTMGGVLKIYDNNGYLNLKAGVESGQTDNAGGTMILYKDSPFASYPGSFSYQRIEIGIVSGYGLVQCKDDAGVVRVCMYGDSGIGPYMGVRDAAGNIKSYLTETAGYINGQLIVTANNVVARFA